MSSPLVVGLDADDTLWDNEDMFASCEKRFRELLAPWADGQAVDNELLTLERERVRIYGYGVKGFVLSMIEAAVSITDGAIPATDLASIVGWGQAILEAPVALLPGVTDAIDALARHHQLLIITKGDQHHQNRKIVESGLLRNMMGAEVVDEKDPETYREILTRWHIAPEDFVMVGNSVRSDIEPVVALGAAAVHIPYHVTWALEEASDPPAHDTSTEWHQLDEIAALPALLEQLREART